MIDVRTEVDLENMQPFGNSQGKNSTVFLANDKQLDHQFVVKKINKTDVYRDYGNEDESNLFVESSVLYKVAHPNISEIQYASFDDDYVYIVMPYYKNGSVQTILEQRCLSMREFIKLSLDFLSGLLFVHANNLVHFDVKPTNILLNNNGKAVIADFGLAKYIEDKSELVSPNKLYNLHFPPEYLLSTKLSRQADIYQAGITMYRMVNGNEIWNNQVKKFDKSKILNGTFPDRRTYLPHVQKKIRKIINKCLDINIDKRYQSVLDIINDLSTVDGQLDWWYKRESSKEEVWKNRISNIEVCIRLSELGTTYEMVTYKTNIQSKRQSRVSTMCKQGLSKSEAYKIIEEYIK